MYNYFESIDGFVYVHVPLLQVIIIVIMEDVFLFLRHTPLLTIIYRFLVHLQFYRAHVSGVITFDFQSNNTFLLSRNIQRKGFILQISTSISRYISYEHIYINLSNFTFHEKKLFQLNSFHPFSSFHDRLSKFIMSFRKIKRSITKRVKRKVIFFEIKYF